MRCAEAGGRAGGRDRRHRRHSERRTIRTGSGSGARSDGRSCARSSGSASGRTVGTASCRKNELKPELQKAGSTNQLDIRQMGMQRLLLPKSGAGDVA